MKTDGQRDIIIGVHTCMRFNFDILLEFNKWYMLMSNDRQTGCK